MVRRALGRPCHVGRTLAVAIVATAALGEILASPSRLRSAFYAGDMTRAAQRRLVVCEGTRRGLCPLLAMQKRESGGTSGRPEGRPERLGHGWPAAVKQFFDLDTSRGRGRRP